MTDETYESVDHILEEVRAMRVRGGSAFGRAAAHAFRLVAADERFHSRESLFSELERTAGLLFAEKPTMATIRNAYDLIVLGALEEPAGADPAIARRAVSNRAARFLDHSRDAVRRLGRVGQELVQPGQTIMMHSFSDSVLSVFEAAASRRKAFAVICTESRPLREGRYAAARLSAAGVSVTFVTDAAMAEMVRGADWVLAGADSIAMDGAVANKMGTNLLAIAAAHFGKPLYIAGEALKLRRDAATGAAIELEMRPPEEVVSRAEFDNAARLTVVNQFFDLTPPERIRGIITEQGVFEPAQIGRAWQVLQAEFAS